MMPVDDAWLVSREQFAATLVEMAATGVSVLKWSARTQSASPHLLAMTVATRPMPESSASQHTPVPTLSWSPEPGLLSSLLTATSSTPSQQHTRALRLGDCLGVHALATHPHANLLPGLSESHFTFALYYTQTVPSGIAKRKSLLLVFPQSQSARFECIARALLYGLHAGSMALTFFDGNFAHFLLNTPLEEAVDIVCEKLNARATAASVLGHLDTFWWAGFGGLQRHRRVGRSALETPLLRGIDGCADNGESLHDVQQSRPGPQVMLFVNGVEIELAPSEELAALLRRTLPQVPNGGKVDEEAAASVAAPPSAPPPPPPPKRSSSAPMVSRSPPPPPPPPRLIAGGVRAQASEAEAAAVRYSKDVVAAFREYTRLQTAAHRRAGVLHSPPSGMASSQQVAPASSSHSGSDSDVKASIEASSPYVAAVKRDVERCAAEIPRLGALARAVVVNDGDLAPVRACLLELDAIFSTLTDERAVLKHFMDQWPELKVDAMRECVSLQDECAAMCTRLAAWRGEGEDAASKAAMPGASVIAALAPPSPHASLTSVINAASRALSKLQPRIELLAREQDSAKRRFAANELVYDLAADLQRVRHAAPALAMAVLKAVPALIANDGYDSLQAAFKFAFKVHQFAGGFDAETETLFKAVAAKLLELSTERAL
jgi:hypothetical protein